ncbi:MAG: peptidase T [Acidobacteria bacterium SCN 69-37]|nr:MAG: peptidase T [Acidobacteria bacterium SCN 69-37]
MRPPSESVVDRFLRYVRINTESREGAESVPSTAGQWDLIRLLERELRDLGAVDIHVSEHGMLRARVPSTVARDVPCVGLLAHVDTSPAVSGANVTPIVHVNYQGGDLVLPGDRSQVLSPADWPVLRDMVGDDVITSDGTTLLGSDDKAGVAAIMTLVDVLRQNADLPHGPIAVGFTTDEEVGGGIDKFDVAAFGAAFAYTVDGDALGEINDESWNARGGTITFHGLSAHPGSAKGVMINAAYAAAHFLTSLPATLRPEHTDGRDGFIHPYGGTLDVDRAAVTIILRDFEVAGLDEQEALVRRLAADAVEACPGVTVEIALRDQYRNMREVLDKHPHLVEWALDAARRAGLPARTRAIRGGTDGSRLTFRGLPCPNIFTGGHNFHSPLEFNSRRGLEKTAETLLHLARIVAEHRGER